MASGCAPDPCGSDVQTMAMQLTESVNTALGGVSPPSVITPSGDGYRTTGESCGTVQSNFF
jgi:hypothetical protein